MSILKDQEVKIEEFKFGSLVPESNNSNASGEPTPFEFESLDDVETLKHNLTELGIRAEREFEAGSSFEIDSVVREHRGHQSQEESDYEQRVQQEVEKRVEALRVEAEKEGFTKGQEEGHKQAYDQAQIEFEKSIDELSRIVEALQKDSKEIFEANKKESYRIVKNLTKWVVLKEVDEKYYLSRLLEKLIYEINTKSNLTVRVNEEAFGYLPEMIKLVERKLGKLSNVRVEADLDLQGNGIILESENSIVDGSLEAQLKSIDKLFEGTGINE